MKVLSAIEIMKIAHGRDLFSSDELSAKREFREYAKVYHEDVYGKRDVFQHISALYAEVEKSFKEVITSMYNEVTITTKSGTGRWLKYHVEKTFELGKYYIAESKIVYIIDKSNKEFYENAINAIKSIKYANKDMQKQFEKVFPNIKDTFETIDGDFCIVMDKTKDVLSLEDIVGYYTIKGENIPDRHVAWLMNRLYNIACFMQYSGIVHNGISISNCYISPLHHTLELYGGWWYNVKQGDKMIGTQKQILNVMPMKVRDSKESDILTDLESIKFIGRKLSSKTTDERLLNFLLKGSTGVAVDEFYEWQKTMDTVYGPRKFIEWDLEASQLYSN